MPKNHLKERHQMSNQPTNALNVYRKLLEVRKSVPYLQKTANGHQYNYVGSSAVLAAVRDKLDEQGLLLFPNVVKRELSQSAVENKDKYGNLKRTTTYFTELFIEYTWVDVETGESVTVPFYAQGIDIGGEKSVGKALTYSEKYFLLKSFNIPTDADDPDSFQQKAEQLSVNYINEGELMELHTLVEQLADACNADRSSILKRLQTDLQVKSLDKVTTETVGMVRRALKDWLHKASQVQQQPPVQQPVQQTPSQEYELDASDSQVGVMNEEQSKSNKQPFKVLGMKIGKSAQGAAYADIQLQDMEGKILHVLARGKQYEMATQFNQGQVYNLAIEENNGFLFLQ